LFTVFLSGLVFLVQRSGGTLGFSALVSKLAKNARRTQFACFALGLLFFFDDYANALVVGSTFKGLTDSFSVCREKLAFLVDATSAPVASIVPLSSWIGFELQQIQEQLDAIKEQNGDEMPSGLTDNAFVFFMDTIPTRFYPIFMLLFQVAIMSLAIEFGPMLIAERKCRISERTDGGDGKLSASAADSDGGDEGHVEPAKDTPQRWWNMAVPLFVLTVLILAVIINSGVESVDDDPATEMSARNIFANSDPWSGLLFGTFGASIFTIFFFLVQFKLNGNIVPPSLEALKVCVFGESKANDDQNGGPNGDHNGDQSDDDDAESVAVPLLRFNEAVTCWVRGIAFMSPAVSILILVWAIGAIMVDIGADRYFTAIITEDVAPSNLPTLVFVLAALLSAATGTSWGTMSIMFPLVSPAAWALCEPLDDGVALYTATMSQILSGSIFGDHSSPLSDTTLLSSVASGCDLFRHVVTQLPYALWVACFAILCGTQMVGGGVHPGWCYFVGVLLQTLLTFLVAAPVVARSGRFDAFTECKLWCRKKLKRGGSAVEELEVMRRETVEFAKRGRDGLYPDYLLSLLGDRIIIGAASQRADGRRAPAEEEEAVNMTQTNTAHITSSSASLSASSEKEGKGDGAVTAAST